jgi:hypothetical protein
METLDFGTWHSVELTVRVREPLHVLSDAELSSKQHVNCHFRAEVLRDRTFVDFELNDQQRSIIEATLLEELKRTHSNISRDIRISDLAEGKVHVLLESYDGGFLQLWVMYQANEAMGIDPRTGIRYHDGNPLRPKSDVVANRRWSTDDGARGADAA